MKKLAGVLAVLTVILSPSTAYADHEYEEDDGYSQEYDQWRNEDRNRNRNRNRGAFSPGPFDDSPVDAFNNVCMPGATCHYDGEPPPDEGGPQ